MPISGAGVDAFRYSREDVFNCAEHLYEARIAEGIGNRTSYPSAGNQPTVVQTGQVSRDARLGEASCRDNFRDGLFTRAQGLQDGQARRVSKATKQFCFECNG